VPVTWSGVRMTRHAKNECRLYDVDLADAEAVIARPIRIFKDETGKPIYEAPVHGRDMWVIVALDEPDLIVTIYPKRK
jgi:hypothetical protein